MASPTQDALDKAWRSTCRIIFGQETRPLADCGDWLKEYVLERRNEKSSVSGKPITLSLPFYSQGAKFISFDEADFGKRFEPFSINEMKDIDSIARAVSERASYSGNIILGNSSHVEESSSVIESHFVLDSTTVSDSKYVAHSDYVRRSQYCFGMLGLDNTEYSVKCMGAYIIRCFECPMVQNVTDCYYCTKTHNCHDCMFCFGVENRSYVIGNTSLPKDRYAVIKKKLVSEMADEIKKEGKIFSIYSILEKCSGYPPAKDWKFQKSPAPPFDMSPVEKAFAQTTSFLLGKPLNGMVSYRDFLQKHVPENVAMKSALSGSEVLACSYRKNILSLYDLGKRMATEDEMRGIGILGEGLVDPDKLHLSPGPLCTALNPVAYCNLDKIVGNVKNVKEGTVVYEAQDCYCGSAFTHAKRCAYCFWSSVSDAIFGSFAVWDSSFCAKCYNSRKMSRALECDSCEDCSDAHFLHNCENVRDSMFCFSAKNLRYAIGNAPLPPEQYRKIKSSIVSQLAGELEKKKDLKWDIFNIGAAEAKRKG